MSLRKRVFRIVENDPELPLKSVVKQLPSESYANIKTYRSQCLKVIKSNITKVSSTKKRTRNAVTTASGGSPSTPPIINKLLDPDYYSNVHIKTLVKNSAIDDILHNINTKAARDLLTNPKFIDQAEIKHGVFWNSAQKPYHRPHFFYQNQNTAIELMHDTHVMYQGGRQKIGKSTAAFNADFEDMLYVPGTVITLVAPGLKQAAALLRQGFKEVLTLDDGTKFDLWGQLYEPYFIVDNVQTYIMKNGSRLQVIACSEHTTPGYATDVLHIEELDKIVKDPQALRGLGAVLPTVRARRGFARFRITCNNTAGIYRILREDLKHLYPWFVIYMEKPWNVATEKFTGKHIIYNEHYDCKEKPDIDDILKIIMDCIMGKAYTQQQLGNIDDYSGDVFNPDKLDFAFKKGKDFIPHQIYDDSLLSIDPGAIHNFAAGVLGIEGLDIFELWAEGFSISGKIGEELTDREKERMIKKITKTCAYAYIEHHCTKIVSESNSGARLIIPFIVHYIRKFIPLSKGSRAILPEVVWSNWGGDREQGFEAPTIISRVDYITLMQTILDYGKITIQDRNEHEHLMRVEFARYKPQDSKEKYKGDFVDMMLHGAWELAGGFEYVDRLIGSVDEDPGVILL